MLRSISYSDGLAEIISRTDPDAEFQLEIEPFTGTEGRRFRIGHLGLAPGADDWFITRADRRGTTVITDGDVLVVGQQGIIRPEQLAHGYRMMDAGVEIGIVADARRQVQGAIGGKVQIGLDGVAVLRIVQQLRQLPA